MGNAEEVIVHRDALGNVAQETRFNEHFVALPSGWVLEVDGDRRMVQEPGRFVVNDGLTSSFSPESGQPFHQGITSRDVRLFIGDKLYATAKWDREGKSGIVIENADKKDWYVEIRSQYATFAEFENSK